MRDGLRVLLRRWRPLGLAMLLTVVTLLAGIALLGVSGWFLTGAALAFGTFNLFAPSALVRGLSFIRILSRYGERLVGHAATLSLLSDLRAALFARLIPLVPVAGRGRTGDFVARLTADVDSLDLLVLQILLPWFGALFAAIAVAVVLALTLPEAILPAVGGLLATTVLIPLLLLRLGRGAGAAAVGAGSDYRAALLEAFDGHTDLVALGALEASAARLSADAGRLRDARLAQSRLTAFAPAIVQLGAGLTLVAVLAVALPVLETGRISGPLLVGVLLATMAAFEVAAPAVRGAARFGGVRAAVGRIEAMIRSKPPVADTRAPAALSADGALAVDGVDYAYGERAVLRGVRLTVAPGERIAILGDSGSGKSTLLHLIARLIDPTAGSIRFGGLDLRDVTLADWYSRVALLEQDAPVFIGTIRDNLRIGRQESDDAALYDALRRARLEGFVRNLPDKLDTWLGESGATLSAGQARRLCLARTLLSPARLLLLDEPTAGLDAAVEASFLGDLLEACEGRTLIVATHATLPEGAVDGVYRMKDGTLAAEPLSGDATL